MIKKILVLLVSVLFFSCATTNIKPGNQPDDGETIVFCGYQYLDEVYETIVLINSVDKSIQKGADARIKLKKEGSVATLFLDQGDYYYTYGGMGQILFLLNDPKIVLNLKENAINYIGNFKMKYNVKDFIFKLEFDNSLESYENTIINFEESFPDLANKFEFHYALETGNSHL